MIKRFSIIAGCTAFGMLISTPNYGMDNDSNRGSDTNQSFKDRLAMFNNSGTDNNKTQTQQKPVKKLNMGAIQQQFSTSERPLAKRDSVENLNKSGNGNVRNFLNNPGLIAMAARTGQALPEKPSHSAVNDDEPNKEEEQANSNIAQTTKVQRILKSMLDEYNDDDDTQTKKEKSKDDFDIRKSRRAAPNRRKPTGLTGSSSDTTEHHIAQETKVAPDQPKMTISTSNSTPMNGQTTQKTEEPPFEEETPAPLVISKTEFNDVLDRMLQGNETIDWSDVGNPCIRAFTVNSMEFSVISTLVKLFKFWIDNGEQVTDYVITSYLGAFQYALNNYREDLTECFNGLIPACKTNNYNRTVAQRFSDNIVWMVTDLWMKDKISGIKLKEAINFAHDMVQQGFIKQEDSHFIEEAYSIVSSSHFNINKKWIEK